LSGFGEQVVAGVSLVALTEAVVVEIVLAAALLRKACAGVWPRRAFLFGWPTGAINVAAFAIVVGIAHFP
jgi:hypothetical protein